MTPQHLNLTDDLRDAASKWPEASALIYKSEVVTFAGLERQARMVATGLYKLGIRKGDRVAFALRNRPAFVALHYGVMRVGAVSVPLDSSAKASDYRQTLSGLGPRAIVAEEAAVGEVMTAGPHNAPVFVVGRHPTARPFEEILVEAEPLETATTSEDLAVIAQTTGTLGEPRGAMLTHGNFEANLESILQIPQLTVGREDVVLGAISLHHLYALNVVLHLSIRQGAAVVLQDRFEPAVSLEEIEQKKVTVIVGVPPMFMAWNTQPQTDAMRSVRLAVSGGATLDSEVEMEFRRGFGLDIWEGYGLTETASVVSSTLLGGGRRGSVGVVLANQEVRIVDSGGNDVMVGDPGEIWVRGPNVFKGYWGDQQATDDAFSGDWFRTGDIGYRDEEGYLWLIDKQEDVITVAGFHVYPKEVEAVLRSHDAVEDAAVVGEADPRQGERVRAFVVLKPEEAVGEHELLVYCTRHLARFKVPAEIEFAESLPRVDSGMLQRGVLRQERESSPDLGG